MNLPLARPSLLLGVMARHLTQRSARLAARALVGALPGPQIGNHILCAPGSLH